MAQPVRHLPSAQVMILGSWDTAPHQAPCTVGSLLLPLPLPLPPAYALSLSLSLSQINKVLKKVQKSIFLGVLYGKRWQRNRQGTSEVLTQPSWQDSGAWDLVMWQKVATSGQVPSPHLHHHLLQARRSPSPSNMSFSPCTSPI